MLGSDKVSVQVHRAQNGFDGVRQNRGAVLAAGLGLTFAQAQQLGQLELERNLVQRAFLDEVGTHARQITFGQLTQALEQKTGDGQTQHRVSQKLQKLRCVSARCSKAGFWNVYCSVCCSSCRVIGTYLVW